MGSVVLHCNVLLTHSAGITLVSSGGARGERGWMPSVCMYARTYVCLYACIGIFLFEGSVGFARMMYMAPWVLGDSITCGGRANAISQARLT